MDHEDLLDQPTQPKKFNKNPLLYMLVSLCFIGFLFLRMHWPGAGLLIIFGGGLSVGYVAALLTRFGEHYFFENTGFVLYGSFVTFSVLDRFAPQGWYLYFGTLALTLTVFFFYLREKEIS